MNINRTGYLKGSKTKNNDFNIIPSGNITTTNMAFPIFANGKLLLPDTGDYHFNTDAVIETPALNKGGTMKKHKLRMPKGRTGHSSGKVMMERVPHERMPKMKMQAGGLLNYAQLGFDNAKDTTATLGAVGAGISLLSPHQTFSGNDAPNLGLSDVLTGAKAGSAFGPWGAGIGAAAGATKDIIDFEQDKKDWAKNLDVTRGQNKEAYDATHKPYGTRGYMQGNPTQQVYSLADGGMPDNKTRGFWDAIANTQTSHSSVSLSKQEGGEIPNDLNELFDRAMEESGGDEEKAGQLVQQYQEHPEMMQNKGKRKPMLKKRKHV